LIPEAGSAPGFLYGLIYKLLGEFLLNNSMQNEQNG
jgi:hypothetical protein